MSEKNKMLTRTSKPVSGIHLTLAVCLQTDQQLRRRYTHRPRGPSWGSYPLWPL